MAEISRKVCTNSFINGMNKDLDDIYLSNKQYRHAENFRILSDKEDQTGSINNIKGNISSIDKSLLKTSVVFKLERTVYTSTTVNVFVNNVQVAAEYIECNNHDEFFTQVQTLLHTLLSASTSIQTPFTMDGMLIYFLDPSAMSPTFAITCDSNDFTFREILPALDKLVIIGNTFVRDEIFLFTCPAVNNLKAGQIWKVVYDETETTPEPTLTLLYNNILNFSTHWPIRSAKGNYENDDCIKIYFTDHHNYLRHFNTSDPNGFALDPGILDVLGDVSFSKPTLYSIGTGSLPCGVIYYTYKQYNKYGGETNFSPTSGPIPLGIGSIYGSNDYAFRGGTNTESSGKSVTIEISGLDRKYNNIQIYSILYVDGTSDPEITKVADMPIATDSIRFTDNGKSILGAISFDEFSLYTKKLFKCKTLEVKNNLLLAGNIEENEFNVDFDARAYRYNDFNFAKIYNEDTGAIDEVDETYKINSGQDDVPLLHDCINFDPTQYKYKCNTHILGGSGPNVSFKIECLPIQIGYLAGQSGDYVPGVQPPLTLTEGSAYEDWTNWIGDTSFVDNKTSFTGYGSPFNVSQFKGYKRGEKYRFGIVFISKKGERSPVKWIADIIMPEVHDQSEIPLYTVDGIQIYDYRTFYTLNNGQMYGVALNVKFSVDISDEISDQISGFEIVRMDRPGADRTRVAQGFIGRTRTRKHVDEDDVSYYHRLVNFDPNGMGSAGEVFVDNVVTFSSPEGIFDQNIDYKLSDKLKHLGVINSLNFSYTPNAGEIEEYSGARINNLVGKNYTNVLNEIKNLQDSKLAPASIYHKVLVGSYYNQLEQYRNYEILDDGTKHYVGGTTQVLTSENPDVFDTTLYLNNLESMLLSEYIRELDNQYGGDRYAERALNKYISTNCYRKVGSAAIYDVHVFGGDIFINLFDALNGIYLLTNEDEGISTLMLDVVMPVESTLNLAYRKDPGFIKTRLSRTQESAIRYVPGTSATMEIYEQDYVLYQYNPAYSICDKSMLFFAENLNVKKQSLYDCRIMSSSRKKNNNQLDEWTMFPLNTFIDINTSVGSITQLVNLKNVIYCIQNNGIGVASIDERLLTQSVDNIKLILGSSDVLPRYDYISMTSGSRHQFSIIVSDSAIYFYDATDRQIKILSSQDASLSDSLGLKSFIYNNTGGNILQLDNPHTLTGINGYYDERYNEIVFTFHKSRAAKDYFTVVFNEQLKCFTGFYTFRSPIYIKHYGKILSVLREDESDTIYIHNFGEYNSFYETISDSIIHFIVNDAYANIKVFDSLSVECEIVENNANILDDFYTKIRCYNNYQNTDWHNLIYDDSIAVGKETNYSRRERLFKLQIPRNIVDSDITNNPNIFDPTVLSNANREFRERMRDKLLHVELIYSNPNNRKFKSSALSTTYRISAR